MDKNTILAMEAGEDLDKLVAVEVMGEPMPEYTPENALYLQLAGSPVKSPKGNWLSRCRYYEGDIPTWRPLPYSTDISAAKQVVEKSSGGSLVGWLIFGAAMEKVIRSENAPVTTYTLIKFSLNPEAICKAALLARLKLEEVK